MERWNKLLATVIFATGTISAIGYVEIAQVQVAQAKSPKIVYEKSAWGAKKVFTTPKSVRGTWYYRDYKNKLQKLTITAHKINGVTIYRELSEKNYEKYAKRIDKMPRKKSDKLYDWFSKNMKSGINVKRRGVKGMNVNEWLIEAGSGAEFLPAKKVKHGKKVKALKIDTGDFIPEGYAYKNPKLAKRIDV